MKKPIVTRLLSVLCVAAVLLPLTTLTVYADQKEKEERDPYVETLDGWFAFETQRMETKPGGSVSQTITAWADYVVHLKGNTSSKTYIEASFKSGTQTVTFHVAPDETAKRVTFYFYVANAPYDREIYQPVDIDITYPATQTVVTPAALPTAQTAVSANGTATVPYMIGKDGTLSTAFDGNVGLLSDADGTPRAAFAVLDKNGKFCTLQVLETASFAGFNFPAVQTAGYNGMAVISIQDTDKASAQAAGIYGLNVNGTFVLWP